MTVHTVTESYIKKFASTYALYTLENVHKTLEIQMKNIVIMWNGDMKSGGMCSEIL